jgi:DNA replication and repair protein RecF
MNNEKETSLQVTTVYLKNFRCFEQTTIDLDNKIVFIYGLNGAGKTSLLEALYYGCYLRSFRTYLSRDLIALGKESFFIKLLIRDSAQGEYVDRAIQIGFANNKRLVKVDNKTTASYKELLSYYRVVSLTEDDLKLIQDGPEERRSFVDQALLLHDPSFITLLREYKTVLDNRNALLQHAHIDKEAYALWTKTLWEHTAKIQHLRKQFLFDLQKEVNAMLGTYIDKNISLSFMYKAKKDSDKPYDLFWNKQNEDLLRLEHHFKRTLFGAHVDDFTIILEGKKSREYASRGQQKMIILLIKIAQIKQLSAQKGPIVFLLDDFMTDFDSERGRALLAPLLSLNSQLIFTSPRRDSALESVLMAYSVDYKIVSI